ncbi:MAG: sugar ABC transporter permease [Caldilineaceae bacterium SB0662_bin_9]|uniref:Sugar ABC transporter permease n=1 Tax=Caldilineaceae bacterium SB0662_bin_9 TaxID=2605258 RepID=A0A6B1DTL4_9CHLR|nr:sugar ABC transporter permease [Caldilineaceae bacterium SB0665_bin_21]MYA04355.1 sugar ABC transporter permease [Caldilineaceae bacterium SB0664_bin_22]MYD90033.1 sugar ABC transporter permease [Caldilineaceae bacterium SB0662_bin_9]
MRRREERDGWLFASPWLLGFLLFTVGPMIASAFFAFTEYDVLTQPKWVGWANFDKALTDDPKVGQALKVTSIYAGVSVPLQILLGLCVALLLNTRIRGLQFYRTVYYLPSVLSGVAVALLWRWIYAPNFGLINSFLARFDIVGPGWLGDKDWALTSMIGMSLWHVGGGIVIYLAGLQGVPSELYEAVRVDGAGRGAAFWHITLPMITPVLFYNLVIGIITALQIFTQALIMTNGGPHEATLFIVLYLYRNAFQFFKMGYASVLAWILFGYILVLTLLVYRSSGFWVFYAGELKSR